MTSMGIAIFIFLILVGPVLIWACMAGQKSEIVRLKTLEMEVDHKIQSALSQACDQNGLNVDQLDLIYERKEFFTVEDISAPHFFKKLKIFRHSNNTYWLGIFYTNSVEGLFQQISELRARRAVFLYPKEYKLAFGALPHRDQLKPLMQKSQNAKLDRFDREMHSGELFAVEPIGQEFGAKFK